MKKKINMPKRINNAPVLFFLVALLALLFLFGNGANARRITQPDFEKAVKQGVVEKVQFIPTKDYEGGGRITGIMDSSFLSSLSKPPGLFGNEGVQNQQQKKFVVQHVLDINSIKKLLDEHKVSYDIEFENSFLRDFVIFFLPVILLIGFIYFIIGRQMKGMKNGPAQFGKSRARAVMEDEVKVTFKDVAGVDEAREDVEEVVDFLKNPKKYSALGGRLPKGCLMVGPPGTGKTLLARAIAGEAKVPFFFVNGSDFVEMFVGVGASRVRDLFEQARANKPCLIFIDEIDAIGGARNQIHGGGGHDEREQTLNALLVELDGFESQEEIIVIGATNRVDILDKALLRPGRFDRQVSVDLPDVKGRYEILKVHSKKVKLFEDVNLNDIARASSGLSGADLANLINEAALMAAKVDKKFITMSDMEEARDKVCWGKERRSRKITANDRVITAYHESGHTIVSLFSKKSKPLHKVTIIPRGTAYLGAMMSFPTDNLTSSKSELIDDVCISMGGKIAEEKIFGEATNGASSDITSATQIVRYMVCEWGMSEKIGFLRYKDDTNQSLVHQYGEDVANEIDAEVKKLMQSCYEKTKKLIDDKSKELEKLAQALLERETMTAREIYQLLDIPIPEEYSLEEKQESSKKEATESKDTDDVVEVGDTLTARK